MVLAKMENQKTQKENTLLHGYDNIIEKMITLVVATSLLIKDMSKGKIENEQTTN